MPRGGLRKGSGRKRLGNIRGTVSLEPDIESLVSAVTTFDKTTKGAAIGKLILDRVEVLPAPPTENHYSVTIRGSRAVVHVLKHEQLLKILNQRGS
jgi:hypothetical protein